MDAQGITRESRRQPRRLAVQHEPWSIFRRNGHRFGAENATKSMNLEHVPNQFDRDML